jgi:hypothetical protein
MGDSKTLFIGTKQSSSLLRTFVGGRAEEACLLGVPPHNLLRNYAYMYITTITIVDRLSQHDNQTLEFLRNVPYAA